MLFFWELLLKKYSNNWIENMISFQNELAFGLTKLYPRVDIFVAVTGVASSPVTLYKIVNEIGQIFVSIYYKY